MRPIKLAILATHPIQYQVPWFRALASRYDLEIKVFFCYRASPKDHAAAGFGVEFDWDVPLLNGYPHKFLENVATRPNLRSFLGLDTPEVKKIIARKEYDAWLLCGWDFKSAWQAMHACWQANTPVMVRGDSHLHTPRLMVKRMLKWAFYRWFIPRFDACLAVGKWSKEYYLHYGARLDRIFLVPHVIDDDYFAIEASRLLRRRSEFRVEWRLDNESVVFMFAGKFIPKKRPMDFVKAVEQAQGRGVKVAGLMVGDGPLRQECETYANRSDLPIQFVGFLNQSQIVRSYIAADALILPSDGRETWGLVVNEAMSCGRPCIVSDQVGCGPDMIILGETGAIFPMGDTKSLARLLVAQASHSENLLSMSKHAQAAAKRNSVDSAVDGVVKALSVIVPRTDMIYDD